MMDASLHQESILYILSFSFGAVGLLLLILLVRSWKRRLKHPKNNKPKLSDHVEISSPLTHLSEDEETLNRPINDISEEEKLFLYLYRNYWFRKHKALLSQVDSKKLTWRQYKPVARISESQKSSSIFIVYSKRSVWELGLRNDIENGLVERFCFIFKGPKAKTEGEKNDRMFSIIDDLLKFRQVSL